MDFGLSRFDTSQRTRRLGLPEITAPDSPVLTLILAPTGRENSRHYNWLLKHAAPADQPAQDAPERLDWARNRHAEFLANVVVVGWENVLDDGQPTACTPENALEFLRQLLQHRPDVFDKIALLDTKPDPSDTPKTDPAELGKE